ncbi:hypothetical protein EPUS_04702 [Endocarpon pusillum Z07020]|uniref:Uncharacterized protein n=1 Tax=Endocarpon pusillum (strain Z07020 / HMAS-L-300199) TaxID=1263415 RepID=U1HN16_ENDPU|nr:uncharacterized protein EPUS_04702 [Endocarpon pusillum Z07020]ERF70424.1 hypothetical protein EPUS_04702 [Endocarpon pusillum Z07020]
MERAVEATTANVRAATAYLFNAFQDVSTPMAIIGGFSVSLRGCTREVKGLDIAASELREVAELLRTWRGMHEQRLIIPAIVPQSEALIIFVRTGGQWDHSTARECIVQVIITRRGHLDAPEDIIAATEMIDVPQGLRSELTPRIARIPILDLPHIFRDKLRNYSVRRRLISNVHAHAEAGDELVENGLLPGGGEGATGHFPLAEEEEQGCENREDDEADHRCGGPGDGHADKLEAEEGHQCPAHHRDTAQPIHSPESIPNWCPGIIQMQKYAQQYKDRPCDWHCTN